VGQASQARAALAALLMSGPRAGLRRRAASAGPRAWKRKRGLHGMPRDADFKPTLCADIQGFNQGACIAPWRSAGTRPFPGPFHMYAFLVLPPPGSSIPIGVSSACTTRPSSTKTRYASNTRARPAGPGAATHASPSVATAGGPSASSQHVSGGPVPRAAGIGCARASQSRGLAPYPPGKPRDGRHG